MNYAELRTEILAESMRDDLVDQVPQFVRRASEMISRELRAAEMLQQQTLTDADLVNPAAAGLYRLPADWLEERTVTSPSNPEALRKLSPAALSVLDTAGIPVAYAVRGALAGWQLDVVAVPAAGDTLDVEYFARPAALVQDTDTSRLLTSHPGIYLDASLFYLYRFTQDLELAQACLDTWSHTRNTLNEQTGRFLGGSQGRNRYNLGRTTAGGRY